MTCLINPARNLTKGYKNAIIMAHSISEVIHTERGAISREGEIIGNGRREKSKPSAQ